MCESVSASFTASRENINEYMQQYNTRITNSRSSRRENALHNVNIKMLCYRAGFIFIVSFGFEHRTNVGFGNTTQ